MQISSIFLNIRSTLSQQCDRFSSTDHERGSDFPLLDIPVCRYRPYGTSHKKILLCVEEAGSTPACLSPSFLASLTPRLTVSYGLTSSRLRNCHISYCAPVLPSWDPYGTSTPERSKHSPCSMTDLSDIPDPGEDRLWSHDIHPTPPFKNDWAYYGIRRPVYNKKMPNTPPARICGLARELPCVSYV